MKIAFSCLLMVMTLPLCGQGQILQPPAPELRQALSLEPVVSTPLPWAVEVAATRTTQTGFEVELFPEWTALTPAFANIVPVAPSLPGFEFWIEGVRLALLPLFVSPEAWTYQADHLLNFGLLSDQAIKRVSPIGVAIERLQQNSGHETPAEILDLIRRSNERHNQF